MCSCSFLSTHSYYTPHRETTTNLQMFLTAGERGGALLSGLLPVHTLPRRGYHGIRTHMECPATRYTHTGKHTSTVIRTHERTLPYSTSAVVPIANHMHIYTHTRVDDQTPFTANQHETYTSSQHRL